MRVTVVSGPVFKPEDEREYQTGESFELAAERARPLIEAGVLEEAQSAPKSEKKEA